MRMSVQAWLLGLEAANVVALRMWRLAAGGPAATTEIHRMFAEDQIAFLALKGRTIDCLRADSKLSAYPPETRATLLDPDKRWLLPIEIARLPADGCSREVDFIAITADGTSDEIEGLVAERRHPVDGRAA
jgi:hypothetical protein